MTSAAFSLPGDHRPRVSLRRRLTTTSTETSSIADEALQQLLDRRARKREGRPLPPRRSAVLGSAVGGVSQSVERFGLGQWLFRALVLSGVAVVLTGAVITVVRHGGARHEVAGTATLNGKPLANATVVFHRKHASAPFSHELRTGEDGRFRSEADVGLPAGLYAVVVTAGRVVGGATSGPAPIPQVYRDPATTPLRVDVCENLTSLHLQIRKQ